MLLELIINNKGCVAERFEIVYSRQYGLELVHEYEEWYDVYDDYGFPFTNTETWNCNSYTDAINKYYKLKKLGW